MFRRNQSQLLSGGQQVGYTLDKSPVYRRDNTDRQTTICTHLHTYGQFRLILN